MPEQFTYDNLFAGVTMPAVTEEIVVAADQNLVKGAVFEKNANGEVAVPSGSPIDPTKAYGLMAETVVTGTGETKKSVAYITGEFNKSKIVIPDGEDIEAFKDALRAKSIFLKETIEE